MVPKKQYFAKAAANIVVSGKMCQAAAEFFIEKMPLNLMASQYCYTETAVLLRPKK